MSLLDRARLERLIERALCARQNVTLTAEEAWELIGRDQRAVQFSGGSGNYYPAAEKWLTNPDRVIDEQKKAG